MREKKIQNNKWLEQTGARIHRSHRGWLGLILVLLFSSMTGTAFAWEVHDVDLSKVNVTMGNPEQSGGQSTSTSQNTPSSWAKEEINQAAAAGVLIPMTGDPQYKAAISRLQFAELVTNMAEKVSGTQLEAAPASTFEDTQSTAIRKAYQAGIVKGTTATTFAPNASITRQEIATMLDRAINYIASQNNKNISASADNALAVYTDHQKVSAWAKDAMNAMVGRKIIAGTSATTLDPKGTTTVEQAVLLVYRTYNFIK